MHTKWLAGNSWNLKEMRGWSDARQIPAVLSAHVKVSDDLLVGNLTQD
jgi:hypothetical protein